jgi:hypothetical protein
MKLLGNLKYIIIELKIVLSLVSILLYLGMIYHKVETVLVIFLFNVNRYNRILLGGTCEYLDKLNSIIWRCKEIIQDINYRTNYKLKNSLSILKLDNTGVV